MTTKTKAQHTEELARKTRQACFDLRMEGTNVPPEVWTAITTAQRAITEWIGQ